MNPEMESHDGVNILPIPPPLEFPYPRSSAESSNAPSNNIPGNVIERRNSLADGANVHEPEPDMSKSKGSKSISEARPSVSRSKFITERPVPAQRGSLLALRRRQTGADVSNTLKHNIWDFESDSTSSSSEDERAIGSARKSSRKRSPLSGGRQGEKAKNTSGRRESTLNQFSRFSVQNDDFQTQGKVSKRDGRLNISVKGKRDTEYWAKALGATLRHLGGRKGDAEADGVDQPLSPLREDEENVGDGLSRVTTASTISTAPSFDVEHPVPTMNIVIMVIGSRGDIQPFLRLGKLLKERYRHRVRIATHPAFKGFVEKDSGLEFFSVGGDPAEIMAFMVKNPGLIPKAETIRTGEIGRRRASMYEMFQGFWRACINATDDEKDIANLKMMGDKHPFVADVIIANPPSFAHVHCAERLGIPLHLMFTFPDSPTQQFPHPMTNIKQSNVDANYTNFISYPLVEMMIWQGLGDLINLFRAKTLGLEPMSTLWAPGLLFRMKVPYTYLWSPGLIPKPADWGPEIDITGFVFLDLASAFKPPESLLRFLEAGEPPVYIGFGSIVVENPDKFTALIFEAVKKAGVRALVSKGWGGLGDENYTPDNVYMLGNTPHDWLFPRVSAVVHHGGAGTNAIGLKCGKPTLIIPFFGDQPFWGAAVAKSGAGAEPIPYKKLAADKLADGIKLLLTPEVKKNAETLAQNIASEGDGAVNAVRSFHRSLTLRGEHSLRCSILEDRVAVWNLKGTHVRLSALAANILVDRSKMKWQDLRLIRHNEWNDFEGPGEPFTGAGAALVASVGGAAHSLARTPFRWAKRIKRHETRGKKKKEVEKERRKSVEINGNAKPSNLTLQTNLHNSAEGEKDSHVPPSGQRKRGESNGSTIGPTTRPLAAENGPPLSPLTEGEDDHIAQELAADTGAGIRKAGESLAKAPMDFTLAIAQGFHNAPRLYGDRTVRKPTRVSGMHSGLKAAGEEFTYGIYDGWTGLVKHPYMGVKHEGPIGFAKGLGKGVGSFVLKDIAALVGPFGYTLKGVHKEITKSRQPTRFIRKARIIQGEQDIRDLNDSSREQVIGAVAKGWHIIADVQREIEKQKSRGLKGRWELRNERKRWKKNGVFDSVEQAGRALEAEREGKNFDEVFAGLRHDLKKQEIKRRSTMGKRVKGEKRKRGIKRKDTPNEFKEKNEVAEGRLANAETGTEVHDQAIENQEHNST